MAGLQVTVEKLTRYQLNFCFGSRVAAPLRELSPVTPPCQPSTHNYSLFLPARAHLQRGEASPLLDFLQRRLNMSSSVLLPVFPSVFLLLWCTVLEQRVRIIRFAFPCLCLSGSVGRLVKSAFAQQRGILRERFLLQTRPRTLQSSSSVCSEHVHGRLLPIYLSFLLSDICGASGNSQLLEHISRRIPGRGPGASPRRA